MNWHMSRIVYLCKICGHTSPNPIRTHMPSHWRERGSHFPCLVSKCKNKYTDSGTFYEHIKTHDISRENPKLCALCCQSCSSMYNLISHYCWSHLEMKKYCAEISGSQLSRVRKFINKFVSPDDMVLAREFVQSRDKNHKTSSQVAEYIENG